VPWSWKGRAIPLLSLWAVRPVQSLSACTRVHFIFTYRPKCTNLHVPEEIILMHDYLQNYFNVKVLPTYCEPQVQNYSSSCVKNLWTLYLFRAKPASCFSTANAGPDWTESIVRKWTERGSSGTDERGLNGKYGKGQGVLQKELSLILANGEREDSKALLTQIAFIHYPALQVSAGIYSSANLVSL